MERLGKILISHWTVLFSILCGVAFGAMFPVHAKNLSFLGQLYLSMLQVATIPITMVALISSFCHLFKSDQLFLYIKKLILWFFLFSCFTILTGFLVHLLIQPGANLTEDQLRIINNTIAKGENTIKDLPNVAQFNSFVAYLENMIPTNIIKAIYNRNDIAVVLFSIFFGISLGITKNPHVSVAMDFFDAIFSSMLRYVDAIMYALPFGLFFLISSFISKIGLSTVISLLDLMLFIYSSILFLFIVFLVLISRKSGISVVKCLKYLKNPYLIALGTSSSFAAMPAAMLAIRDSFEIDKQNVELVLPLGVSLFKPGIIIRSMGVTFFLMQLFHISFTPAHMGILVLTATLSALASSAGPSILSASMFSMVLAPLGIPPAVGIFVLLTVEPLIDPITTVLNIQSTCAITVLVGGTKRLFRKKIPPAKILANE